MKTRLEIVEAQKELAELIMANTPLVELKQKYMGLCHWARRTNRPPGAAFLRFYRECKRKPLPEWQRESGMAWQKGKPVWV